jgi:spore coat protein U domain-containing protein, fimbrial subunit CupE1/2/3/6
MRTHAQCRHAGICGLVLLLGFAACAEGAVTCTASASSVAFGTYDPLQATPAASTGSITVSCSATGPPATVNVLVSLSTGMSGSYAPRKMFSGANTLNYNLYFNTTYAQIWGDGSAGTFRGAATLFVRPGVPSTARGTVYGMIPAGQDVAAGSYADTIVMTVTY